MRKNGIATLSCLLLCLCLAPAAYAQELVAGGQVVGIQIQTDGIIVAGLAPVETAEGSRSPAYEAGLKQGDLITELGGRSLDGAGDLIAAVSELAGAPAELTVERQGRSLRLTVQPALSSENQWRLGLWLRDRIEGIGTLTFYDPATGLFGALGHSVSDLDSGVSAPMRRGAITQAEVLNVKPGAAGAPGELDGCADTAQELGALEANTEHGIFGHSCVPLGGRTVELGQPQPGPASILATVSGRQSAEYEVRIDRLYRDSDGLHLTLSVTDPALLRRTGGIVQGMSGSPILQNGCLVGAVTHVFVNQPARGYGISIQDMLLSANSMELAA